MALAHIKNKIYLLLRSSEKYTKTDMIYLLRGGFWLTLSNILTSAMVFVMAIIFASKIPAHTYGVYKFFLSILGILSITTLTGIGAVVSQAVARGMDGSLFIGLKTKIRWGVIGSLASISIALYYYSNGNKELWILFLIASLFIPFMDSFHIYQDYLQGKKLFSISSRYISLSQLIATALMIATVFITSDIFVILIVYLSSWTFIRMFFFARTVKQYPPNSLSDPATIPLGKHSSYIDIIATLIGSLDSILIFHYLGSIELAVYSFAIAPVTQMVSLFRNIPTLAMPKMAPRPIPEISKLINKRILLALLIAVFISLMYIIFTPFIFKIFFPNYMDSVIFSRIYALTILISIPLTILSSAVNAKITYISKKMLYLWNIPGLLSTLFIFIFIQKIGMVSVIYGRMVLLVATTIISYSLWRYIVKKDAEKTIG